VTPLLQLTQIITQSDAMVSGLNTNVLFRVVHSSSISEKQRISSTCTGDRELYNPKLVRICDHIGSVTPAGFYSEPFDKIALYHDQWPMNSSFRPIAVSTVDGFFGGCTALNATLASTFDCLYNIKCLENLTDYFPNLTKMRLNWSDSVLTSISIVILVVFTLLNTRTITATESSPSLDKYKDLQSEYPNTTKCPCSHSENRHETFVSFYHRLHQVCSSDFVNDSWISMLALLGSDKDVFDWEHSAASRFRLISNLCQLAQKTINDTVQRLSTRSFITPNSLTEYNLKSQLETILAKFDQSIIMQFNILINTMHLLIEVDQPFSNSENVALKQNRCYNSDGGRERIQYGFLFKDLTTHASSDYRCFCVTEFDCTHSMKYLLYNGTHYEAEPRIDPVPGAIRACFIIDSVLLSTLEYLYVPECLSSILHIVNASWAYNKNVTKIPYFNPRPLIHDTMTSRFPPKAPFSTLVKEMMIEEWNQTFSFEKYYNACAPNYCKYSYEESTQSFIEVIIKVVSTISGLTMVLRLITNQLMKLIFRLFKPKVQRQEQDRLRLPDRIEIILRKIPSGLCGILSNLNLFPLHTFGSNIDRVRAKYLGQLTTRLYIVLLIIGLAILILYSVVKPPVKTETIEKPSFDVYERLIQDYKDTLRCPCTFISSTYDQYITMKPKFHQICTSSFVSNKWRHIRDPSIYTKKDYRLFLSSHLQFLTGLCNQSIQSVDASVYQFLSSLFITPELLSKVDFNKRIDLRIEQGKESAPRMFTHLLRLLRDTNHGNAIISGFGTNFEYIDPFYSAPSYIVDIKAINYDGCSCGLYANCTIQATLVDGYYSSENVPIMGLKMGCTPTESFLASNLACFYNSSCIKLIYDSTNYD
ncbi:unnamed protein product, partial [Adineta steineri]